MGFGNFADTTTLYINATQNATGLVLEDTEAGSDVALTNLTGLIDMTVGEATVINVPTIKEGGSKSADLELIKNVYENGAKNGEKIDTNLQKLGSGDMGMDMDDDMRYGNDEEEYHHHHHQQHLWWSVW